MAFHPHTVQPSDIYTLKKDVEVAMQMNYCENYECKIVIIVLKVVLNSVKILLYKVACI